MQHNHDWKWKGKMEPRWIKEPDISIHHFAEQHFIGLAWALSKVNDLDLVLGLGHSKQSTNTHWQHPDNRNLYPYRY